MRDLDQTPITARAEPSRVARMMLAGCAVMLLLGTRPMVNWAQGLPDGPVIDRLYAVTLRLDAILSHLWIADYHPALRRGARDAEAARFPNTDAP